MKSPSEKDRAKERAEKGLPSLDHARPEAGSSLRPSPSAGDLRELPMVPLRCEGSCGGGGAPRDSAGSGATEEGLISRATAWAVVSTQHMVVLSHI